MYYSTHIALCLLIMGVAARDKQIKLDDIERDNLQSERKVKEAKYTSHATATPAPKMQYGFVPIKTPHSYVHPQYPGNNPQQYVTANPIQYVTGAQQQYVTGAQQQYVTGAQQQYVTGAQQQYVTGAPQYVTPSPAQLYVTGAQQQHQYVTGAPKHQEYVTATPGQQYVTSTEAYAQPQQEYVQQQYVDQSVYTQQPTYAQQVAYAQYAQGKPEAYTQYKAQPETQAHIPKTKEAYAQPGVQYVQSTAPQQYENVQYVVDNHLQQTSQPQKYYYPQYYYVQPYPSASNNVQSVADTKGNVQYVTYVPSNYLKSEPSYESLLQYAAPQMYVTQQDEQPEQYVTVDAHAKTPEAYTTQSKTVEAPQKYTEVQYVPSTKSKYENVDLSTDKKRPTSLLDSYIPSYLQYQYYKQQQAGVNSIREPVKYSHVAGKTEHVKNFRFVQDSEGSHVNYRLYRPQAYIPQSLKH